MELNRDAIEIYRETKKFKSNIETEDIEENLKVP
jgi:hypothetical protein